MVNMSYVNARTKIITRINEAYTEVNPYQRLYHGRLESGSARKVIINACGIDARIIMPPNHDSEVLVK